MDSKVLNNWIQILTGSAVLLGMGLVVWELQQTRELVKAQLVNDGFISQSDTQRTFMGEAFASTYTKACFHSEELTDAELFQMIEYTWHLLDEVARAKVSESIGDSHLGWELKAQFNLKRALSTKVGQAAFEHWQVARPWITPIAKDLMAKNEITSCDEEFGAIFKTVRAE